MRTVVALLGGALAAAAWAQAPGTDMSQVQSRQNRGSVAQSPPQVSGPAPPDRAAQIKQLPKGLSERTAGFARPVEPAERPSSDAAALAPPRRNPSSVNADEIARLLDTGAAASIEAAAAIASGSAPDPDDPGSKEPGEMHDPGGLLQR